MFKQTCPPFIYSFIHVLICRSVKLVHQFVFVQVTRAISQKICGVPHQARAVLSLGSTVFVDPMVGLQSACYIRAKHVNEKQEFPLVLLLWTVWNYFSSRFECLRFPAWKLSSTNTTCSLWFWTQRWASPTRSIWTCWRRSVRRRVTCPGRGTLDIYTLRGGSAHVTVVNKAMRCFQVRGRSASSGAEDQGWRGSSDRSPQSCWGGSARWTDSDTWSRILVDLHNPRAGSSNSGAAACSRLWWGIHRFSPGCWCPERRSSRWSEVSSAEYEVCVCNMWPVFTLTSKRLRIQECFIKHLLLWGWMRHSLSFKKTFQP